MLESRLVIAGGPYRSREIVYLRLAIVEGEKLVSEIGDSLYQFA